MRKTIIAALLAAPAILGVVACEPVDAATPGSHAPVTETEYAPIWELTEEPTDNLTVSQRNAVDKAESYLEYSAFSETGLVDQLEYEGFSTEDAQFAVTYVAPDWMAQAVAKAESYMEYSSFSQAGLADQLEYEGFTPEQAAHGAASQF